VDALERCGDVDRVDVLVILNKIDTVVKLDSDPATLAQQMEPIVDRITNVLKLNQLSDVKKCRWHVEAASAVTGYGVNQGFDWLIDQINQTQ